MSIRLRILKTLKRTAPRLANALRNYASSPVGLHFPVNVQVNATAIDTLTIERSGILSLQGWHGDFIFWAMQLNFSSSEVCQIHASRFY